MPHPSQRHREEGGTASASRLPHLTILLSLWLAIFATALAGPPLLDDADATHAQAAQAVLSTGDWVTLHVDGVRYLEKAPLPYWIAALSLKLFPAHPGFAVHLPLALTVLALALLGYAWSRRAFGDRAALYTAIFTLTAAGVFLFTRIFIPDALLSLWLAIALYAFLLSLTPTESLSSRPEAQRPVAERPAARSTTLYPYLFWTALALAVLTKGLVAIVFLVSTALLYMALTGQFRHWRRLRPFTGLILFLAIAAPWHILASLRNTGGANGHGFFWFYFVNEHILRFLGRRIPRDYNKLPTALYWSLHLVWLFPWSLFAPAALLTAWRNRNKVFPSTDKALSSRPKAAGRSGERGPQLAHLPVGVQETPVFSTFAHRTVLLLLIFSTLVLLFFSLSTNQEYYTFPVYLPLLMLLAASLTPLGAPHLDSEMWVGPPSLSTRALTFAYAAFLALGLAIAAILAYGLWTTRHAPFVADIGSVLAHRGVGDYTLSMSHFFDLTGPSFAALRLPAALAALAFTLGPIAAWVFHARRRQLAAILAMAATSAAFLIAAHIALLRFAPILSSADFATDIQSLERSNRIEPDTQIALFGDQAFGSSIPFYLNRQVLLVDGRSTSMLFGCTFPDAPPIFLTQDELLAQWGTGARKILFVPLERRADAEHLLPHAIVLAETSGKLLLTDRPLP